VIDERHEENDAGSTEVADDHELAAVPAVGQHPGELGKEEPRHDPGCNHEPDRQTRQPTANPRRRDRNGEEEQPIADRGDDLRQPEAEELIRREDAAFEVGPQARRIERRVRRVREHLRLVRSRAGRVGADVRNGAKRVGHPSTVMRGPPWPPSRLLVAAVPVRFELQSIRRCCRRLSRRRLSSPSSWPRSSSPSSWRWPSWPSSSPWPSSWSPSSSSSSPATCPARPS